MHESEWGLFAKTASIRIFKRHPKDIRGIKASRRYSDWNFESALVNNYEIYIILCLLFLIEYILGCIKIKKIKEKCSRKEHAWDHGTIAECENTRDRRCPPRNTRVLRITRQPAHYLCPRRCRMMTCTRIVVLSACKRPATRREASAYTRTSLTDFSSPITGVPLSFFARIVFLFFSWFFSWSSQHGMRLACREYMYRWENISRRNNR